ncbi:MAG: pyridoxamine 5'-phosphate oxidase family protein [Hyphomicrobiaceae bacterium]|nr:pyridoxamine 5'-phosphate oxidase family protein [Hyphomicrobiaceae bacterium]
MTEKPSDIAFSDSVKAQQKQRGSRRMYERMEASDGWPDTITPDLALFIAGMGSFYLATASASGQPYIQHRGGSPGFLKVVDDKTLGFADYAGNRQYITLGNLAENPRAFIFLMDYARRIRIKLWGTASVDETDDALLAKLSEGLDVAPQRSILFKVEAWDRNCPQHIPRLIPIDAVEKLVADYEEKIAELQEEIGKLRGGT